MKSATKHTSFMVKKVAAKPVASKSARSAKVAAYMKKTNSTFVVTVRNAAGLTVRDQGVMAGNVAKHA